MSEKPDNLDWVSYARQLESQNALLLKVLEASEPVTRLVSYGEIGDTIKKLSKAVKNYREQK